MYKEEISEFLLGEMSDTFNCELEDGSDQEVAFAYISKSRLPRSFFISTRRAAKVI